MNVLRRSGLDRLFNGAADEGWGGSLERLPLALVRLDAEGRHLQLNTGWQRLTEHPVGASLGKAHAHYLHPEDRSGWLQALQRLREGGEPGETLLRYLTRNGGLRWVEVRLARDGSGFVAGLCDVTEQMHGRRSLQASHRALGNLLDDLPMMVYRCRNNRLWSMEYVSAGCLALTGYRAEQLIDSHETSYNGLIHPDDREAVWSQVQDGLSAMRPFGFDYRLVCADGSEKQVHERGCGIFADNGEVLGLEGVVMERLLATGGQRDN
ncbi:PAS domain-containing protein [Stutzerimonas tarimensis]|uniref:histidine kinase n=1 Tax=Stutzerimonas tarimensis TaxID=1507735 RepID=A0ABV7T8H3_9GAMM